MAASSVAGIITASATIITAIGGLFLAFAIFLPALKVLKGTKETIDGVHVIVNQQHTDMLRYQAALILALKAAGIDIPTDQSTLGGAPND